MSVCLALLQAGDPSRELGSIRSELGYYVQLVFVLALVIGLAFVILRIFLPRIASVRRLASGPIQVSARYALEPRKHLYIVRVGLDYHLVGTSDSGMHYLAALDASRIEPALSQAEASPPGQPPAFARVFQRHKGSS
jgi:flagellar biogenesis protein FliO